MGWQHHGLEWCHSAFNNPWCCRYVTDADAGRVCKFTYPAYAVAWCDLFTPGQPGGCAVVGDTLLVAVCGIMPVMITSGVAKFDLNTKQPVGLETWSGNCACTTGCAATLAVSPVDGNIWVGKTWGMEVAKLTIDGSLLEDITLSGVARVSGLAAILEDGVDTIVIASDVSGSILFYNDL